METELEDDNNKAVVSGYIGLLHTLTQQGLQKIKS